MIKSDWLKFRKLRQMPISVIHFAVMLNPTVEKMNLQQFTWNLNMIKQQGFRQHYNTILNEAALQLDKHFGVQVVVNKNGQEIWCES